MHKALKKFGFAGPILSAIVALCSTPSTRVYTSNVLSQPFLISNGTRRDCPLSLSIFNLLIEPLAEAIKTSPQITLSHFNKIPTS